MQLVYAFLADAADIGRTGKISVVGGDFETIYVSQVPALHPQFVVLVRLLVAPDECERAHTLNVRMASPASPIIVSPDVPLLPVLSTTEFTPHQLPGREGESVRYHLVITMPLVAFVAAGEYRIHIIVDDSELGEVSFRVEKGQQPS
jgi:uncharacterized protein DUF6941